MLCESPRTVTQVLEMLTGEPIRADVVRQGPIVAGDGNALGVSLGHPLIQRIAVLRGGARAQAYVYAESNFVPDRLPQLVQRQLAGTSDPIGRILMTHGVAMTRKASPHPEQPEAVPAVTVDDGAHEVIWVRSYLLCRNDLAVFAIREWFFASVLDALDRHRPA